ncbi:MAG: transglycosylase domain-containing protein [Nitrospirae bacterium]|nr:transglycosylase domain-containing protein [Nitrospirota bacterium]
MKTILSLFLTLITILLVIVTGTGLWIYKLSNDIPVETIIKDFRYDAETIIYDRYGKTLYKFTVDKNQVWVPISAISKQLQYALIATEDPYFMRHSGIDYRQTWESVKDNLRVWQLVRGGSTITQQVAKNVFLSNEKTITRKIKEYFLARRLEKLLPKERIIELYLNEVGWGYGIYGAELASRYYLDKHASDLNTAEAAFLISMLRNPAQYNPFKNPEKVIKRRQLVLKLLLRHKFISNDEYNDSLAYTIEFRRDKKFKRFKRIGLDDSGKTRPSLPCHVQLMQDYLVKTLGYNTIYDVGVDIRSTIDNDLQNLIEGAISKFEAEVTANTNKGNRLVVELLLVSSKNKVRAVGCTSGGMKTAEKIKSLGRPYNHYTYNVVSERKILWNNILLIDAGAENSL